MILCLLLLTAGDTNVSKTPDCAGGVNECLHEFPTYFNVSGMGLLGCNGYQRAAKPESTWTKFSRDEESSLGVEEYSLLLTVVCHVNQRITVPFALAVRHDAVCCEESCKCIASTSDQNPTGNTASIDRAEDSVDVTTLGTASTKTIADTQENSIQDISRPGDPFDSSFSKPRVFVTNDWDLIDGRIYTVSSLLQMAGIAQKLQQWHMHRFTPVMQIDATGSTFDHGAWMFGFCPLTAEHDFALADIPGFDKSGNKHVVMDLHGNPSAVFRGKWCHSRRYGENTGENKYGSFFLAPLTPLASTTTGSVITIRVKFWLEDVQLDVPRAQSVETAKGLSLNPPHCEGVEVFKNDDDHGIDTIWKRPTVHDTFNWAETSPIDTPVGTVDLTATNTFSSAANIAGRMFDRTGVAVLQLFCVKTPVHSGRLEVRYGDPAATLVSKHVELCYSARKTCVQSYNWRK